MKTKKNDDIILGVGGMWNSRLALNGDFVKNKTNSKNAYINYNIIRLLEMFEYKNLPDTIPQEVLETNLLLNGHCAFIKDNGKFYTLTGSFTEEPNIYYRNDKYIISNPKLSKGSITYDIGTENRDAVLLRNDMLWLGLYPMLERYSSLMSQNILTINVALIMLRIQSLLSAPDDKTKAAAEIYLKKLEDGDIGVILENYFLDGIKMQTPPTNNGSYLTQFIEMQQYLKGSFYNEIGLNANYNMKRESLGDSEIGLNEDMLMPLCDQMLRCRQEDFKKVNELFGLDIQVEFSSSWKANKEELLLSHDIMKSKASQQVNEGDKNEESDIKDEGTVQEVTQDEEEQKDSETESENNNEDGDGIESNDSRIVGDDINESDSDEKSKRDDTDDE